MPKKDKKVIKILGKNIIADEKYYLNNPNLPKGDSTYTYTPEMIAEIDKCRNDIIYFAEHHFFINGFYGKEIIKLFDKQREILKGIQKSKKNILVTSRQVGKCICGDTKVKIRFKYLPIPITIKVSTLYKLASFFNKIKEGLC